MEYNYNRNLKLHNNLEYGNLTLPLDISSSVPEVLSFLDFDNNFFQDLNAFDNMVKSLDSSLSGNFFSCDFPANVHVSGNVFLGENVEILPGTIINGPCVISHNCRVGPNAFIRPGVIIGKNCSIGFGVELNLSILFNCCSIKHYAYVGRSVIGANVNISASTVFATRRLDDSPVRLKIRDKSIYTNQKKLGAFVECNTKIGVNVLVMPGSCIKKGSIIYPGEKVSGYFST
jgi:NDP-sugar pyrophosphorylase family protein